MHSAQFDAHMCVANMQKQTLKALRARGKKLLFVTNNAGKSRKGYVKRFTGVGLDVKADEVRRLGGWSCMPPFCSDTGGSVHCGMQSKANMRLPLTQGLFALKEMSIRHSVHTGTDEPACP